MRKIEPVTRPWTTSRLRTLTLSGALLFSLGSCTGQTKGPEATPVPAAAAAPMAAPAAMSAASLPTAAAAPVNRDWDECPAIARVPDAGDILVVGDVHGDYKRLRKLLLGTGIIAEPEPARPEDAVWNAGDATLVLVGDFTGKHDQSLRVIALLMNLQQQASEAGGRLIATLGNHEAEFLAPDLTAGGKPVWHKKTRHFLEEIGADDRVDAEDIWRRRGSEDSRRIGDFLHCLPAAAASEHWFFAHAGSTGGRKLDRLRTDIEQGVRAHGYKTLVLMDGWTGLLEARLKPPEMVWWQKSGEDPEDSEARLREHVAKLGVKHMAVGHQAGTRRFNGGIKRKKGRVFQLFDGTLYLTDVGMSRGHDPDKELSPGAVLHIERGGDTQTVRVICRDGISHRLPPEGESASVHCEHS